MIMLLGFIMGNIMTAFRMFSSDTDLNKTRSLKKEIKRGKKYQLTKSD